MCAKCVYVIEVVTVFSLLYKVYGIVRVLFLRVFHFFRLWSCLQWCFPITWNRWYATADGCGRTTRKLPAAWPKKDAKYSFSGDMRNRGLWLTIQGVLASSSPLSHDQLYTGFKTGFKPYSNVLTLVHLHGQRALQSIMSHQVWTMAATTVAGWCECIINTLKQWKHPTNSCTLF